MRVVGKEDLGLTLSLACSTPTTTNTTTTATTTTTPSSNINNNHQKTHNMGFLMMMNRNNHQTTPSININSRSPPLQLNLMMPNSNTISPLPGSGSGSGSFLDKLYRTPSTDSSKLFLKGIDVNKSAVGGGEEDEVGVSSPNSTVSTVSGKRSIGERDSGSAGVADDVEAERTSSRGGGGMSDDEEGGENSRKKLRLTKDQSATLEESFKEHNTLNPKQKLALAKRLGLRPRQVEVWFQNRRARTKLKQTEVDCEFLKRCCEQLTEENRRLHKEVQELRQLKLSPQFYMQMTPPTTLTMCPSCERVGAPPSATATASATAAVVASPRPDSKVTQRHMAVNPWALPIRS